MLKPENKIIIVDDKPEHLQILSQPFIEKGIGCRSFVYDANYNEPLTNVRIAFFDIRINPTGGGSESQRFNELAMAIKQYIRVDNGPFALIFWTSNKGEVDAIKKYIHDRHADCPKPFLVDIIDKHEFLEDARELTSRLETVLSDETLRILFEFETISAQSASTTINQLFEIIPRKDAWGETADFKINFEKVFSKIAIQNSGYAYAKHNPAKGVISSLLPLLNHHIKNISDAGRWKTYLTSLANSETSKDIAYPENFSEGKLNAIFHIDAPPDQDKEVRGCVIEIDKSDKATLRSFNIEDIDGWFNNLIPFYSEKRTVKKKIRDQSKLIAVEISSACDYSNNKKRINKYSLGFITPKFNFQENINDDIRTESSYHVGQANFHYEGQDFQIWLNLNFVFGTMGSDDRLGKVLFVLKKEIMDMIGNKYANHVSRIGITSF